MSRQVQDAYIVAAARTPIGKAPRGVFRNTRPDDLLVAAIRGALAQAPSLDPAVLEDAIIGCAIPEAEQGLNVARISVLLSGLPNRIAGVTVNRFCASGITAIAMAADRIRVGEADAMIAGGTESMSMVPMMGNRPSMNMRIFDNDENVGIAYGMGMTAENVANRWKVSRADQDAFALASHQKAIAGQQKGEFKDETVPVEVIERIADLERRQGRRQDPHRRHRRRRTRRHQPARSWGSCEPCSLPRAASPRATVRRPRMAPARCWWCRKRS